jgi:glycosyltransferase involved in cell wall biosynthesis
MRVAILSFYLMESTMPLAKHISERGSDIDLYCLLPKNNQNTFVFDFLSNKQPHGFVPQNIIRKTWGKRLWDYFSCVNTKIYIFPAGRMAKLLLLDVFYAYKLARQIKKEKYEVLHIIHTSTPFWNYLYFFLPKNKIIQTLHEVTSHDSETPAYRIKILESLIKNSTPVIFNSVVSKQRFIDFKNSMPKGNTDESNLSMIRFGLFETYHCFSKSKAKKAGNEKIKILNLGRIVPYKGIHILIEAVKNLQDKIPIDLVVAGEGVPYFDFKGLKNYKFINRFCSNEEIINLIEDCDMIVLPYISASQSGVPMTAFAFNKPIIASNIGGFKEVIDHMQTGLLVDNLSAESLASSIEILAKNKELREAMSRNIEKKYSEGEFSWKSIAEKTIFFYKKQMYHLN